MEELIEQYLFQHKKCPLPLLGSLHLKEGEAITWHGDNTISAPVPYIEFSSVEIPAEHFVAFIASHNNISNVEAAGYLEKYCHGLQNMAVQSVAKIDHAGKFYIDENGTLVFKQIELPREFMPAIPAMRVIHPKVSHNIRVGDKETTSAVMSAYYNENETIKKDRWWIMAIILTVIGAAILFIYLNDNKFTSSFGNTQSTIPASAIETYQTSN